MSWKEIEKELLDRFENEFSDWQWPSDRRIHARLAAPALAAAVQVLADSGQVRFITATAVETPSRNLDVWYHFDVFQTPQVFSFAVSVPASDPVLLSIAGVVPNAAYTEREIAEAFGIRFQGHPAPGRLLLPETWPKGAPPMRKG